MLLQMRTYELAISTRDAFHVRFRDHSMRIFERHGFDLAGGWEHELDDGRRSFSYVLRWADADTMQRCWEAFRSDAEWAEIKRRSEELANGPLVGRIDDALIDTLDHLPNPLA